MNRHLACEILEIDDDSIRDPETIRRQYRRKALQCHPDRNPHDPTATETFQRVHDAYEFLTSTQPAPTFRDLLFEYLTTLSALPFQDVATQLFYTISERLATKCEEKALQMLEKLDRQTFLRVYALLKKCDVFIEEWKIKLNDLYDKKAQIVQLQPRLEDLFADNVFRVTLDGHTYYIPLWHHELVYDRPGGGELTVRCTPALPDHMTLDADNNLHVHIQKDVQGIWLAQHDEISLCSNKTVAMDRKMLYLREHQRVTLKGQGIARIQEGEIYDVSQRADIVLHLRLVMMD